MNQPVQAAATQTSNADGSVRIAIVSSRWHKPIVNNAVLAAQAHLIQSGISAEALDLFEVPGAFELPLHAKVLTQTGKYQAIIVCGLVVNGGIYQHEYVASAVIHGLMQIQLESGVPVFSAVLTPLHFHEHEEHISFFEGHFVTKGKEVAEACIKTLESLKKITLASA